MGEMSWVGKKIHLYNVTMGLYMLDWWERCLFSILPSALDLIPLPLQFVKKICWMARRSSLCAVHHHLIFFSDSHLGLGWVLVQFVRGGSKISGLDSAKIF
jgi:hypothetical protein